MGAYHSRLANEMYYAIQCKQEAKVLELIKEYPEVVSVPMIKGFTNPICRAVNVSNQNIVMMLLKYGADVNQRSQDGRTPLMWAAFRGK